MIPYTWCDLSCRRDAHNRCLERIAGRSDDRQRGRLGSAAGRGSGIEADHRRAPAQRQCCGARARACEREQTWAGHEQRDWLGRCAPWGSRMPQCPGHAQSSGGLGLYARACKRPRVCRAGGPIRCYPGGLAVCRAIGDADVGAAVSAVPAVQTVTCDITASGSALVICSDGVWDSLTHDQVAKCTVQCASAAEAAKRVVDKASRAHQRGLRDDITAAVAWLGTPPWPDKPGAGRRLLQRLSRTRDWLCSRDSGFQSPSPNPRVKASPSSAKGFGGGKASFEHSQPPGSSPSTPATLSPFSVRPRTAAKSQS